jgi:hypothetical protein
LASFGFDSGWGFTPDSLTVNLASRFPFNHAAKQPFEGEKHKKKMVFLPILTARQI